MRHLRDDQLIDLVDGVVVETDVPHLATCTACRQQLTDLRNTLATAAQADVPEPSPLFWDHFSSRVREAVARENGTRQTWWQRLDPWVRIAVPMCAAGVMYAVFTLVLTGPVTTPFVQPPVHVASPTSEVSGSVGVELLSDSASPDDQSL